MNRVLTAVNFLGVLILVGMSVVQWRTNGQIMQESDRLEQTRIGQAGKIADQDKAIKGFTSDLDDFRQRLAKSDASSLKDSESKLAASVTDRNQIAAQRDQLTTQHDRLKANLDKWTQAVSGDQAVLKQAGSKSSGCRTNAMTLSPSTTIWPANTTRR